MKIILISLCFLVTTLNAQTLLGTETFDSDFIVHGSSASTSVWFGPDYYIPIDYNAAGGCSGGYAGYQGSWNNYWMNFLRTPAVDCSGLDSVILSFDLSNSYFANHGNDKAYFNIWIDGGYEDAITNQTIYFDQARNCVTFEVIYDLTPYIDKTAILFYLNANCGYNDSQTYYVCFDNISISGIGGGINCNPFAGNDTATCGLDICFNDAFLSDTNSTCIWSTYSSPVGAFVNYSNFDDPNTCITVNAFGHYEFIITETNGTCTGSDTIAVDFNEIPWIDAGTFQFVCGYETDMEALYTSQGYWLPVNGIIFTDSIDPNTHIISDHYGTDVFTWVEYNQYCSDSFYVSITFDPCSNIENIIKGDVNIYPNPSNGIVNIEINQELYSKISIFDMYGRKVFNAILQEKNITLNLDKGLYSLILSGNSILVKKLLIVQ